MYVITIKKQRAKDRSSGNTTTLALFEMCGPIWVLDCIRLFRCEENQSTKTIVIKFVKQNVMMDSPHEKRPRFILVCIAFTMSNIAC